jgi:kynurenine formamidase
MVSREQEVPQESFAGERILRDYIERLSNWGRWGEDDQLGALNFVGPAEVKNGASLVRSGKVISMTLPYDSRGPQVGPFRANPLNVMTATGTDALSGAQDELPGGFGPAKGFGFADDVLITPNQAGTQWDALCHIFWEGRIWNGRSAGLVTSSGGAFGGIEQYQNSLAMRGVLLDVARYKGAASLEPGYAITADDLDGTASSQRVEIKRGDAVIVRTGYLSARRGDWQTYAGGDAPGLSLHTAPWLHRCEVAAIASDTWGIEVRPNEIDLFQPLHIVALVHMGLAFGEIFDLEPIAADCAQDEVYEFLFVAPALPITGAAGSPVNALAIK